MESLLNQRAHLRDASVRIACPNWGLSDSGTGRAVVMHHGHCLDGMSGVLGDGGPLPATMRQLEQENGPWIDSPWSDLGGAGEIANEAGSLYGTMLSAGASHDFAESIARGDPDDLLDHTNSLERMLSNSSSVTSNSALM